MSRRQGGFTLLETLLALTLLAVIGVMASRMVQQGVTLLQFSDRHGPALAQLQYAFTLLERDITGAINRPVRTPGPLGGSAMEHDNQGRDRESLVLTHSGWINPGMAAPRSTLQRVRWRLEENGLVREWLPFVDMPDGAATRRLEVMPGVSGLRLRFWHQGGWQLNLPTNQPLPQAVEITLITARDGEVTRRFLLPGGTP